MENRDGGDGTRDRIDGSQFYNLITGEELSWQSIIYDLIKTEQLDPWDIDLAILSENYLKTIEEAEEGNFFVSSKVLLACSLLLRLKSEILANSYIQELNDILYGRQEVQRTLDIERYIINESELPLLVPKSPMARHKKVTLDELMQALNKAINTENRRIKRTIKSHQARRAVEAIMPRGQFIPLRVRVKNIFGILSNHFEKRGGNHLEFGELANEKEEILASFLPILHLSHEQKIFLHQPVHFEKIFITKDVHPEEERAMKSELELYEEVA